MILLYNPTCFLGLIFEMFLFGFRVDWIDSACNTIHVGEHEIHCECFRTGSFAISLGIPSLVTISLLY